MATVASLVDLLLHRDCGGSGRNWISCAGIERNRAGSIFANESRSGGSTTGDIRPRWLEVVKTGTAPAGVPGPVLVSQRSCESVDFLHDGARAGINQHDPIARIDVAILRQGRTPIGRHRLKLDISWYGGADDDLFASLNRADPVLGNIALDPGSRLRLDLNRGGARPGGYGTGLGISQRPGKRRRRSEYQQLLHGCVLRPHKRGVQPTSFGEAGSGCLGEGGSGWNMAAGRALPARSKRQTFSPGNLGFRNDLVANVLPALSSDAAPARLILAIALLSAGR